MPRGALGAALRAWAVALAAASVALGTLALAASLLWPGPAGAESVLPALPDDDALDAAVEHQRHGHALQAEQVLRRLAESGHVVAMERLALMHWYGGMLFGAGPWKREIAAAWFERAAQRGSELGRHVQAVAQGHGVAAAAQRQ